MKLEASDMNQNEPPVWPIIITLIGPILYWVVFLSCMFDDDCGMEVVYPLFFAAVITIIAFFISLFTYSIRHMKNKNPRETLYFLISFIITLTPFLTFIFIK